MRYALLLAFLLLNTPAEAKVLAELRNMGNGKIVLTDETCRQQGYRVAYTQMDGYKTLLGCWAVDDSFVHIMWYDNDLRSYPLEGWTLKNIKPNT